MNRTREEWEKILNALEEWILELTAEDYDKSWNACMEAKDALLGLLSQEKETTTQL